MYDIGFREAAIRLYENVKSMKKVSEYLEISLSTIWNWLRNGIESKKRVTISRPREVVDFIKTTMTNNPVFTQVELRSHIVNHFDISLSRQAISCIIARLGYSRKTRGSGKNKIH